MTSFITQHLVLLLLAFYGINHGLPPPGTAKFTNCTLPKQKEPDGPTVLHITFRQTFDSLNHLPADSVKVSRLAQLAREVMHLPDTSLFYLYNSQALVVAQSINHPYLKADVYWNWGEYHLSKFQYSEAFINYRKAELLFATANHTYYRGKMFYNMGFIESLMADYSSAELNLFKALSLFKFLGKKNQILNTYNLLGSLYDGMENHSQAISYYQAALNLAVPDLDSLYPDILNNLAVVYQKTNALSLAIDNYKKALTTPDLKAVRPELYARLLDNLAYAQHLFNPEAKVEGMLLSAWRIRDSLQHLPSVIISHLHLSDYYKAHDQMAVARSHAQSALQLSLSTGQHRDQMGALKRLSFLEPQLAAGHLSHYIEVADALRKNEHKQREKFARIKYETDDYIKANVRLSQQKLLWIAIAVIFLILLVFIYWSMSLRIQNRQLGFTALLQESDEAIFALRISQWRQGEQARQDERERLAEELHDSVLTQLFGMRLHWETQDLEHNTSYFEAPSQAILTIEQHLRAISHNLIQAPFNQALLIKNLETLLKEKGSQGSFDYTLRCESPEPFEALTESVKVHLFRIVEEALHNIVKHAGASQVEVSLYSQPQLIIVISDNGSGFRRRRIKKGLGLRNMRSRSQKINATFHCNSHKNGTTITIRLKHQHHE